MIASPSLEAIFSRSNLSFIEQIRQVHSLGFRAFEFWGWMNKDVEAIRSVSQELGISVASFGSGGRSMVDSAHHSDYIERLKTTIEVAKKLECRHILGVTGNAVDGLSREQQRRNIVQVLKACAPLLEAEGMTLILEPLNTRIDHRGYFLESSAEAFNIIDEVSSNSIKVLFDIYHQQISEGNLILNITNNIDKIAYFHVADHPGRHQLGTGEINYHNVLKAIKETGYTGYIGLEYYPIGDINNSLLQTIENYKETLR